MISGEKWTPKTEQEETEKSEKLDNWTGDNKKSAEVLPPKEEKPPLQERIFKQLLDFSQAVQSVEEELKNNPEASLDSFAKILDQYDFSSRQQEAFLEGIEELLRRRGNVARALQRFEKEYGEQCAPELFKALFKSSGTSDSLGLAWGDKDDILNKNFNREVETAFSELETSCRSAIEKSLEIFHRIDETEKSGQAGLKKNLVPILISQPLDKWPRLLELALRPPATKRKFSRRTGE